MQELPERLVFLNGAPGSGKTKALDTVRAFSGIETAYTMSTVISRHRQIHTDSLKSITGLACDEAACSAVASTFRTTPMGTRDLILDGFPRSDAQVRSRIQAPHFSANLSTIVVLLYSVRCAHVSAVRAGVLVAQNYCEQDLVHEYTCTDHAHCLPLHLV